MKNFSTAKLSLILFVMLEGCPGGEGPYRFFTGVNSDGTCRRELIRTADSAFVMQGDTSHNPFPMKLDSSWQIEIYKKYENDSVRFINWPAGVVYMDQDSGKSFSWFVTAVRDYPSVKDMEKSFRYDNSDWGGITPDIQMQKKFRWFYTYYEYSEAYPESNPFSIVPISDYMNDVQVAALYGEDKELYRGKNGFEILDELRDLNEKSEKWLEHNLYEELYKMFADNYDSFKDAPVNRDDFIAEKDTIYKYYMATDSSDFTEIDQILNHHFHTDAYRVDDEFDKALESKVGKFLWTDKMELNYMLQLPGKIIETNAPFINNDTLSWKVNFDRFHFNDYTLKAVSRKPNNWAFGVTALIVLSAGFAFIVRKRR